MSEAVMLALAGIAGAALGAIFFGGLWWTVRKGVASKRPALWFFGSQLLRTAIVLAGFYLVSDGRWQRILACLIGFFVARFIVTLSLRPAACPPAPARQGGAPVAPSLNAEEEASHAS